MQTKTRTAIMYSALITLILFQVIGCQKSVVKDETSSLSQQGVSKAQTPASPNFNLEVSLRGEGSAFGLVKFRQENDAAKIITLGVWVRDLQPDHQYLLQRAVDTNLDGNCTGTAWLTLGKGLQAQSITTDGTGTGREDLWRDVSAIATGSTFDIHFRVIDATTHAVVLTSDCYQYTVR
ncbi:MAG: hypothetical protein ACXVLT_05690 [Flavisolibacter sp.]